MSKDRLLSHDELRDAILSIPIDKFKDGSPMYLEDVFPNITDSDFADEIIDLINTQKRLYAESVIGEDEPYAREAGVDERYANHWNDNTFNRNELRAEQRARIK